MALGFPVVPLENRIQIGSLKPMRSKVTSFGLYAPIQSSHLARLVQPSLPPSMKSAMFAFSLRLSGR